MGDVLVVQSKVKALVKKKKMAMSADAVKALSAEVKNLITKAIERAKANGRKTIKARDI